MRRLVLALMIALLPLRGWVGDAMDMEMASVTMHVPVSAMESGAHSGHGPKPAADSDTGNAWHADCPGHAASPDGDPQTVPDCGACAACHAVALTPTLPQLAPAAVPAAQPQTAAPLFASAERAPGFKPPIS